MSNLDTSAVFRLRDYQPKDLEKLYRLDQECFEAGISYARAELRSFIERHGSFCVVAELEQEWTSDATVDPEENSPTLSPQAGDKVRAQKDPTLSSKEDDKGRAQKDPTLSSKEDDKGRAQSKKFEKGTVAAFIVTELHPKGYGHIITIDVRREFRRMELGSKLLMAAEERLQRQNAFMVVLEVAVNNRSAITFYKRHQFNVARTIPRYYKNELDAFFMTKRL